MRYDTTHAIQTLILWNLLASTARFNKPSRARNGTYGLAKFYPFVVPFCWYIFPFFNILNHVEIHCTPYKTFLVIVLKIISFRQKACWIKEFFFRLRSLYLVTHKVSCFILSFLFLFSAFFSCRKRNPEKGLHKSWHFMIYR